MTAPRYWLARTLICGSVLVTAIIGKVDTTSQHHDSLSTDGLGGSFAATALIGLGITGLLDVIFNRGKPRLVGLWRFRFLIYLGMAFALLALVFANVAHGAVEPLIFRYLLDATGALAVACLDLKARR